MVDEFAEMLVARPEFLDVFTAIGRLGRSLGIHLLLATQRLEEGRLRGLESHLSYRIGLRTFSGAESRAVLGVPDAAELPAVPGTGLLRTGPGDPVRFRAAYVSGPATATTAAPPAIRPFDARRPARVAAATPRPAGRPRLPVACSTWWWRAWPVTAAPARPVWLPPLEAARHPRRPARPGRGRPPARAGRPPRAVPTRCGCRSASSTGPASSAATRWSSTSTGQAGHVAVVGAPRSGRTTLLQTVVAASR